MNADKLIDEYLEERDYGKNRKPYWLFVDVQDAIEYSLFNYFPEAHYKAAIDQVFEQNVEERIRDGGQDQYQDNE